MFTASRAAVLRDFAGAWCGIRAASARSVSGEVASDRSRLAGSLLAGLICRFPDGVVVGEDHACGVKLLDAVNPGGCDGQGLGVLVAACLPGEGIGAVCAGGVWRAPRFPDSSLLANFRRRAGGSGTRR